MPAVWPSSAWWVIGSDVVRRAADLSIRMRTGRGPLLHAVVFPGLLERRYRIRRRYYIEEP